MKKGKEKRRKITLTYLSRKKLISKERGGGNDRNEQYISLRQDQLSLSKRKTNLSFRIAPRRGIVRRIAKGGQRRGMDGIVGPGGRIAASNGPDPLPHHGEHA